MKDLAMIIIGTCTNYIGATPPNLCVIALSAVFFSSVRENYRLHSEGKGSSD